MHIVTAWSGDRKFLPVKSVFFLPAFAKVLTHKRFSDCWSFLCITVESLPHNIKHLDRTVVVIWCNVFDFIYFF